MYDSSGFPLQAGVVRREKKRSWNTAIQTTSHLSASPELEELEDQLGDLRTLAAVTADLGDVQSPIPNVNSVVQDRRGIRRPLADKSINLQWEQPLRDPRSKLSFHTNEHFRSKAANIDAAAMSALRRAARKAAEIGDSASAAHEDDKGALKPMIFTTRLIYALTLLASLATPLTCYQEEIDEWCGDEVLFLERHGTVSYGFSHFTYASKPFCVTMILIGCFTTLEKESITTFRNDWMWFNFLLGLTEFYSGGPDNCLGSAFFILVFDWVYYGWFIGSIFEYARNRIRSIILKRGILNGSIYKAPSSSPVAAPTIDSEALYEALRTQSEQYIASLQGILITQATVALTIMAAYLIAIHNLAGIGNDKHSRRAQWQLLKDSDLGAKLYSQFSISLVATWYAGILLNDAVRLEKKSFFTLRSHSKNRSLRWSEIATVILVTLRILVATFISIVASKTDSSIVGETFNRDLAWSSDYGYKASALMANLATAWMLGMFSAVRPYDPHEEHHEEHHSYEEPPLRPAPFHPSRCFWFYVHRPARSRSMTPAAEEHAV
jgi:hypothetical protein